MWLPDDAERAERDATEAVTAYETAEPEERSFGDEAGARTDLALARIGAASWTEPVKRSRRSSISRPTSASTAW